MESNDVGVIFVGWGMSIDSKRAKERQKRTPDELVMVKMVKLGKLKLAWAVVPLGWAVVPLVSGFSQNLALGGAVVPLGRAVVPLGGAKR